MEEKLEKNYKEGNFEEILNHFDRNYGEFSKFIFRGKDPSFDYGKWKELPLNFYMKHREVNKHAIKMLNEELNKKNADLFRIIKTAHWVSKMDIKQGIGMEDENKAQMNSLKNFLGRSEDWLKSKKIEPGKKEILKSAFALAATTLFLEGGEEGRKILEDLEKPNPTDW